MQNLFNDTKDLMFDKFANKFENANELINPVLFTILILFNLFGCKEAENPYIPTPDIFTRNFTENIPRNIEIESELIEILKQGSYPFLFPSTTPTDFHADEARLSIEKILNTKADKAYLTHYDVWTDMKSGAELMLYGIDRMESIYKELIQSNKTDVQLQSICEEKIMEFYKEEFVKRKIPLSTLDFLKPDATINAQGLVFAANRAKKKG